MSIPFDGGDGSVRSGHEPEEPAERGDREDAPPSVTSEGDPWAKQGSWEGRQQSSGAWESRDSEWANWQSRAGHRESGRWECHYQPDSGREGSWTASTEDASNAPRWWRDPWQPQAAPSADGRDGRWDPGLFGHAQEDPWADGRDGRRQGYDYPHRDEVSGTKWTNEDSTTRAWTGWRHFGGGFRSDDQVWDDRPRPQGRPSEKLSVPSFSAEDGDDVGTSARSYLRQIEAWRRMTLLPPQQQGLVLYQHLGGKAWVAAEELDVDQLSSAGGVSYLVSWITARFLDLEITRIGKAFSEFFRRLRRRPGQSIRDYNSEYDRLHARLREVGCNLPEACAAWVYVDRLQLDETAELNLLASVGNSYSLQKLQQAAVIHDRGHRKPWEGAKGKKLHNTHMTDAYDDSDADSLGDEEGEGVAEEVATAYVAFQNAKAKYRDQKKSRGYDVATDKDKGRDGGKEGNAREERIRAMKAKSFCSGCGRRGHWHKDSQCPNNRAAASGDVKEVEVCYNLPSEVFAVKHSKHSLLGITDTACARTVAGTRWLQDYTDALEVLGMKPALHKECEAFRFGAGKVYYSSFYVIVSFELGDKIVEVKTSIISGDIPLLLSKAVLGKLGMIYNVGTGDADFVEVGLRGYRLVTTASGHPAIPIVPAKPAETGDPLLPVEDLRLQSREYMVYAVACAAGSTDRGSSMLNLFHDKKLDPGVKGMLIHPRFQHSTFLSWWQATKVTGDFWVERLCSVRASVGPCLLLRDRQPMEPRACGNPPAISKMTKAQLLEECNRVGLLVHHSWSVEELKSCIQEHRQAHQEVGARMTRLHQMNMEQLRLQAKELGIQFVSKTSKGSLLRMIRDNINTPAETLMPIGKWKGLQYKEIPKEYGEWCLQELNSNSDPDFVRFARWYENDKKARERSYVGTGSDMSAPFPRSPTSRPGTSAVATGSSDQMSSTRTDWSVVSAAMSEKQRVIPVEATPNKKRAGNAETTRMEAEIDEEALEEIRRLEAQLAVLKNKAGYPGCCGDFDLQDGITEEEILLASKNNCTYLIAEAEETYEGPLVNPLLSQARNAYVNGDFSFSTCRELLEGARLLRSTMSRGSAFKQQDQDPDKRPHEHTLFGLFTHGGVHGLTKATESNDWVARYVNAFGKFHLPEGTTWTSVSVMCNVAAGVHCDYNNSPDSYNHAISFGQTKGGELWIEEKIEGQEQGLRQDLLWKKDKQGNWIPGTVQSTLGNFKSFKPGLKHAVLPWEGDRWSLVYHTTRSITKIGKEIRDRLRKTGFPLPRKGRQDQSGERQREKKPNKRTRNVLAANASKIGVLLTTLVAAVTSYMCDFGMPEVKPDPIVMFEIGGLDGTSEAVDLGKAVLEPMSWEDYSDPDRQETAYHFVCAASPRELRLHMHDLPSSGCEAVIALISRQLDDGGCVVLQGEDLHGIADKFPEYIRYRQGDGDTAWVVLERKKEAQRTVPSDFPPYSVCVVGEAAEEDERQPADFVGNGSAITFDTAASSLVQGALRRLHQNLGHPRCEDLVRHLRLAGCEPEVLKVAKSLKCQVCDNTSKPKIARPSTVPRMLDFNQCVGADLLFAHDVDDVRHTFLNLVDWGTSYQVVVEIKGTSAPDLERAFNDFWLTPFGPPSTMSVDLEGGLQKGLGRLCDWHNIKVKHVAAQGHWQAGITERQGAWWKDIWERVVHDMSISKNEAHLAATCVTSAKNQLRRRCGHSPFSWVFGRDPRMPEDLLDPDSGEKVTWDVSAESKFQRQMAVRSAARIAFHKSQGDDRLRKALMQRARTTSRPYEIGEPVHFWHQPKNRRRGRWAGPAVVVGNEGGNYWISRNGRCRLTAPEHLRPSGPEEVGELLQMRGVQREVARLLEADLDEDDTYDGDQMVSDLDLDLQGYSPTELDPDEEMAVAEEDPLLDASEGVVLEADEGEEMRRPTRRLKRKTAPGNVDWDAEPHQAMIMKRDLTKRGVEKRQEKELRWSEIPNDQKELFKSAERVQWDEHISFDALEAVSLETSDWIRENISSDRILRCRWAYKDKNWARRRNAGADAPNIPWKCKSRLVIAGHTDPDLGSSQLTTDAPTLSRTGLLCLMQRLANGLREQDPWTVSAGDIRCAFLTGGYLRREEELFLHQPSTGFPGLHPRQLVRIKKNIFGLATSPHEWWQDLQSGILDMKIEHEDGVFKFCQSPMDPCVFALRRWDGKKFSGRAVAFVGTHVDDLLVVGPGSLAEKMKEQLSRAFPIDSWEQDVFNYVGVEIVCTKDSVRVNQTGYVDTRLFLLPLPKGCRDEDLAGVDLIADNRSLVGALSWVSAQTRPDLTCGISLAQQVQKAPTYGDIRFTNSLSIRATQYRDAGLEFHPLDPDNMVTLVYHDAAWANAFEGDIGEEGFELYEDDKVAGLQRDVPPSFHAGRKAKRQNSRVASQLGGLILFANKTSIGRQAGHVNVVDWKSRAGQRVCRSTFGAETQACVEGLEGGQYVRSFYESLVEGEIIEVQQAKMPLLCLSDCRSLYDHLHKQGVPRVPQDRRLAIDLAALRQQLKFERWSSKLPLAWVPSPAQLGDILTKPQDSKSWWADIAAQLLIPVACDEGDGLANRRFVIDGRTSVKHRELLRPLYDVYDGPRIGIQESSPI
ncbi:GIP [Symbiodinium natans]|uniref:GIP protein n=1 Tax=Symbiodinium natans TaxID=878477 RepID=A0A812SMB3_9DINO|nr:GIP [Symbiodinium natans]